LRATDSFQADPAGAHACNLADQTVQHNEAKPDRLHDRDHRTAISLLAGQKARGAARCW
jgi:hypothetical protein